MTSRADAFKPEFLRDYSWKYPVLVATTANITLSGEQTIDGVLTSASRVLVKDQSTGSQNGIYVSAAGAWARAYDMDTGLEALGSIVYVISGTASGGKLFRNTNTATVTIATTALTFAEISASGAISYATPSIALGSAAAAGAASTVIRSDSTIAAFDATVPTTITSGASAATGSAAFAARRDHVHGIGTFRGEVVMVSGSVPPDPVLNSAGDDWIYSS